MDSMTVMAIVMAGLVVTATLIIAVMRPSFFRLRGPWGMEVVARRTASRALPGQPEARSRSERAERD